MIRSFGSKDTERIWHERYAKGVDRAVQRTALRKLELIHAANDVEDLRTPPGRSSSPVLWGLASRSSVETVVVRLECGTRSSADSMCRLGRHERQARGGVA